MQNLKLIDEDVINGWKILFQKMYAVVYIKTSHNIRVKVNSIVAVDGIFNDICNPETVREKL